MSQVVVAGLALAMLGVACGGSSSVSPGPTGDASTTDSSDAASSDGRSVEGGGSGAGDDANATGDDGSAAGDDGGQVVSEGGSNPVLDGGDDGGGDQALDGGACNGLVNAAPSVTSACASVKPILAGGQLVAGTYYLTGVTAFGTAAFCKNGFIPVGFKETGVMTVNGEVGSFNSVLQLAATAERRTSATLTPGVNNSSPLTEQTTCPVTSASDQAAYEVRKNVAGKTVLVLRFPYAKDRADYRFELQ